LYIVLLSYKRSVFAKSTPRDTASLRLLCAPRLSRNFLQIAGFLRQRVWTCC
jgi:hypothetical protein